MKLALSDWNESKRAPKWDINLGVIYSLEIVKIQILPDFLSNNENKNRKQKYLRSKQKQPKASVDATLHYNNISPVKSHTI